MKYLKILLKKAGESSFELLQLSYWKLASLGKYKV